MAAEVGRSGPAAQRTARFRLEIPDPKLPVIRDRKVVTPQRFIERTKILDLKANTKQTVEFQLTENLPLGTHHGFLEIVGEDSLEADNIRYFTIEARQQWELLVIHGSDVTPDNLTEAVIDETNQSLFNCTVVSQRDIPNSLQEFDAIFILDPDPGFSESMWSRFRQYVEGGRGLAICLGANAAEGGVGHATFGSKEAQRILTGKLDRQWRRPDADLFFSPDNLVHPVFAPFRKMETSIPWYKFPVFIHWSLEDDGDWETIPTKTVLRYGNGMPAMIERQLGQGRVLVMTTPITESAQMEGREPWNHLFIGLPLPAWLLVREISEYLVRVRSDRLNLRIGEVARLKNDPQMQPNSYRLFTPRTNRTPEKITVAEDLARYRFTQTPGHYRLKGKLDRNILRGFSVNLSTGQTSLERVERERLDRFFGAENYQLATERNQIQRQQGETRRGQEFYPLIMILLIVVMGVEYLMSNRFYS
ncbi:MAG: hypothetical protein AAGA30_11605 [Planctomycetota bacterium]